MQWILCNWAVFYIDIIFKGLKILHNGPQINSIVVKSLQTEITSSLGEDSVASYRNPSPRPFPKNREGC